MLELKNVSKFYYSKGVVASGFNKINLKLNIGEFVAITGESGSGKSTLLNVISGLDSYEEGEMYINGEETSGYSELEFEKYRKKYIANIFQNFNLINSYTVYQNIELMFIMNGFKTSDVKQKILDVIDKVNLTKYKNTKVSKLSGGQKQRVAIARALIKETPIIVADEPTGNLDSKSALEVIKLLSEISKDKLVIVVTHNYDQIEKYVTRKIKMHDGKIIEDKIIKNNKETQPKINEFGSITKLNKIRLGIRNAFNIKTKFILLLFVYFFLSLAVISEYSAYKKMEYVEENVGYNSYFSDVSDKRLLIQKKDKSEITNEDIDNIKKLSNIDYVLENDILIDKSVSIYNDDFYFTGNILDISLIGKVDYGRMPENEYEIVIGGNKESYYLAGDMKEKLLGKEFVIHDDNNDEPLINNKLTVVGIVYRDDYSDKMYVNQNILSEINKKGNVSYNDVTIDFNDVIYSPNNYSSYKNIVPSDLVPEGSIYIPDELNYTCKNNSCLNYISVIRVKNIYFSNEKTLTVTKLFNKKNVKNLLNIDNYEDTYNKFYMNTNDYYNLFNKGTYQISTYVKNPKIAEETVVELENLGYKVNRANKMLASYGEVSLLLRAFKIIVSIIVILALFFISYFIIKIILKSRNIYYSTIRILGSTKKDAKYLLDIELLTVLNVAYSIILLLSGSVMNNIIKIDKIRELVEYLKISDYIILYAVLIVISLLVSNRYAKKLFSKSAMNAYREEV